MTDLDTVGKWLVWPRFREEGPPKYLRALLTDSTLSKETTTNDATRQVGYLILLGYRPATVIGITSAFLENDNKPLYGAALGRILEQKYGLSEGQYTEGRHYEDRISKIVNVLVALGILREEVVGIPGTEKTTSGYRLATPYLQVLKARVQRGGQPVISDLVPNALTARVCQNDHSISLDVSARYCQFCGSQLAIVCSNCGRPAISENLYCISCGQKLS